MREGAERRARSDDIDRISRSRSPTTPIPNWRWRTPVLGAVADREQKTAFTTDRDGKGADELPSSRSQALDRHIRPDEAVEKWAST